MVLEKVGSFLGSPLILIGLSTTPFERGNGESAFIVVDAECSDVDEE